MHTLQKLNRKMKHFIRDSYELRFIAMVFIVFVFLAGCSPSPVASGPRITSYSNLYKIGLAIRQYKLENGALPMRLSDIVPRNMPLNQIGTFYMTNNFAAEQVLPLDWKDNPSQIDVYSSYDYVGRSNMDGVIAFEKPNLWKPTAPNADKLAVLFSDFHVQYIATIELKNLIKGMDSQSDPIHQPALTNSVRGTK